MALKPFNSIAGFSYGSAQTTIIDDNGNIIANNLSFAGNLSGNTSNSTIEANVLVANYMGNATTVLAGDGGLISNLSVPGGTELTDGTNSFVLDNDGNVVFEGSVPGQGIQRGLVWDFGANANGFNSEVRQDNDGLSVRAWTEQGGGANGYSAPVNIVTNQDATENTWTFDGSGNLTLPGNLKIPTGNIVSNIVTPAFNSSITGINSGNANVIITIASEIFEGPASGRVTISGVNPPVQVNDTWYYDAVDLDQFQLYTDANLTTPVDGSSWPGYVDGGTAVGIGAYGNLTVQGGNVTIGSNDNTWTFDTNGTITLPSATGPGSSAGFIQTANAYPTLLAYGSGGHGGPELDWMNGDNPNDRSNANVLRNTLYLNDEGLYVGMNENGVANTFIGSWTFTSNGTTIFPTLEVDLHNGGVQTGQVLQFGNSSQQAIITGPTPATDTNAQRLIIQGQRGNGQNSEGGDVYFWAGDADTYGGDIKIYAGDADNVAAGFGGYVNIDGGAGFDQGGQIALTGGQSANGPGGYIDVNGGQGRGQGGNVSIQAGYGEAGPGGVVTIQGGGSGNGLAEYGNVGITAGASSWTFDNAGNLTLPANTFAVNYANGTQVPLGGAGNTGNVTFDDQIVIGTGDEFGGGGLYLSPAVAGAANLQYLRVRGGDYPTHIHLDTGNNQYYDQYFGADSRYVKLEANGNIVINADDYNGNSGTWNFDITGNLTVPGNIQSVTTGFPFTSTITGVNTGSSTVLVTLIDSVFGAPETGQVTISGVVGTTEANNTWYFASIDPSNFQLYNDAELTSPVDGTTWTPYVSGGLAVAAGYSNIAITGGNVEIVTNTGNTWTFDNTGNLNLPLNGNINANGGGITQAINKELNIVVQDEEDDGWSIFNTITDGLGNNLSQTQLDSGSFTIGTASGGNTYSWSFEGNTLQVSSDSQIRSFGSNVVLQSMSSGSGGTASVQSVSNTNDPNIFTTIDATTTGANITVYNGGSNSGTANTWTFDNTGVLTVPGEGVIKSINDTIILQSVDTANAITHNARLGTNGALYLEDAGAAYPWLALQNSSGNAQLLANGALTVTTDSSNVYQNWIFDTTGNLTVPKNILGANTGAALVIDAGATGDSTVSVPSFIDGGEQLAIVNKYASGNGIRLETNGGNWLFGNDGNFTLPANTFAVNYANGTQVSLGGSVQDQIANGTSNVTIPAANGNVEVNVSESAYVFDDTGVLTLPNSFTIGAPGGDANITTINSLKLDASANVTISSNSANWVFDTTGNLTAPGNISTTGNIFAPAIVQNAALYDTRIELSSSAGIIQANTNGNVTQFLPGGSMRLPSAGASDIIGGTFDGSSLTLNNNDAILAQIRGGNVKLQVGDGGTVANTWTFAQDGSFTAPGNIIGGNIGNATSVLFGDGANISNIAAPSVTLDDATNGNIDVMMYDGNIKYTSNITVNPSSGNLYAAGTILASTIGNATSVLFGEGGNISNIAAANITGTVANATYATSAGSADSVAGANVSGEVSFAATANSVAGANVSGEVANAAFATTAGSATTATSAGSATVADSANAVAGANVSGEVGFAATANSVAGSNVTGEVAFAAIANSVAVANVSGLGNIATVNLDGNSSNVLLGNGVFSSVPSSTSSIIANGNSNVTIATTAGNAVTNVNGTAVLTVYSGGIKVGGSGILQSPGGATAITLNNNGASIPTANITNTLNVTGAGGANITANLTAGNISTAGNIVGANIGNAASVLFGDGANITGIAATRIANGTSNVGFSGANGNVTFNADASGTMTFDTNGNLSLPIGGSILVVAENANYNGIQTTDGVNRIWFDSDNSIKIVANNTQSSFNADGSVTFSSGYVFPNASPTTGQALVAGATPTQLEWQTVVTSTGNIAFTQSNITSDQSNAYVQLNNTGALALGTTDSNVTVTANAKTWTFGTDGNLYTPESGQIRASSSFYGISMVDYSGNSSVAVDAVSATVVGTNLVRLQTGGLQYDFSNTQIQMNQSNIANANVIIATTIGNSSSTLFGDGGNISNIAGANITGNISLAGNIVGGNIGNSSSYLYGNGSNIARTYGQFYSTATQTNPVANSTNTMTLNTTDINNGVTIASSTEITIANAGKYNIQFSAQFDRTTNGTDVVYIWLSKNGDPVAYTNTSLVVTGTAAGNPVVAAWNWLVSASANDYYEIQWASADTDIEILADATPPLGPEIPSIIVTVTPVGA